MLCFRSDNTSSSQNQQIEQSLKRDATKYKKEVRILLLGTGESGKSTVFKQMKILQENGGYKKEELQAFIPIIRSNLLVQMQVMLHAAETLGIQVNLVEERNRVLNHGMFTWSDELGNSLKSLWNSKAIQTTFERRNEFQLNDSAGYFFEQIDTLIQKDYLPTEQDALHCRVTTTGIEEATFMYGFPFKMIDVGGQRTERRKWIHFFDKILNAIIFCVSLSEYDQVLREDSTQNRTHESLKLFHEVANNPYFRTTPIILFLNKIDLFREKFCKKHIDITRAFPDYTGGFEEQTALEFIRHKFNQQNLQPKEIYTHVTCAVETESMRIVFNAVQAIITNKTISEIGIE